MPKYFLHTFAAALCVLVLSLAFIKNYYIFAVVAACGLALGVSMASASVVNTALASILLSIFFAAAGSFMHYVSTTFFGVISTDINATGVGIVLWIMSVFIFMGSALAAWILMAIRSRFL